jgi:hypothetical protein
MTNAENNLQPWDDLIVSEIRHIREDLFAEFDYDLEKYTESLHRKQKNSGRHVVTRSPRRPDHGNGEAA